MKNKSLNYYTLLIFFLSAPLSFAQIEGTARSPVDPTRQLQMMQMVPVCPSGTLVAVSGTRFVCGQSPSASIDYSDCEIFYHSEGLPVGTNCGNRITRINGECSDGYVLVGMNTGLRFPNMCFASRSRCCRLR